MATIQLVLSFLILIPSGIFSTEQRTHGFDLEGIEKIGGLLPTGFHTFGALIAIKIKKILLVMMILIGTALATKLLGGLLSPYLGHSFGHGFSHPCPHFKPVFVKELDDQKEYENFGHDRPQYEEQYHRRSSREELSFVQELLATVQKSFKMMEHLVQEEYQDASSSGR